MDERQYSRAIDVHRISEYPEVQNVINSLLSELNDSNLIKNSPRKRILKHLKVVILDLYVAYMGDPLVYVSYPRSKDAYRQDQRMKQLFLGYGPMTTVINGLAALGYLEDHRGFYDQGRKTGFQSRMRATPKIIDLIDNFESSNNKNWLATLFINIKTKYKARTAVISTILATLIWFSLPPLVITRAVDLDSSAWSAILKFVMSYRGFFWG